MSAININGERFSAGDVNIYMLGRLVTGITEINYAETQEVNPVRVLGSREPAGYTRENYNAEGSFTMLMGELVGLGIAANGKILDIAPFPITVVYVKNGLVVTDNIEGAVIKNNGRNSSGGSTDALSTPIEFWCQRLRLFGSTAQ
jgi:hypothetical protein